MSQDGKMKTWDSIMVHTTLEKLR